MKQADPKHVPNVFVQQACLGRRHAAEGEWVKRRSDLNGFAPYEVWDHPEYLLSFEELRENPVAGPLTLSVVRGKIIRTVAQARQTRPSRVTNYGANVSDVMRREPVAVRDEDPAPLVSIPGHIGTVNRLNGGSRLLDDRRRQKLRHRSRPRSSAFRRS